jgi:hypothetical protein
MAQRGSCGLLKHILVYTTCSNCWLNCPPGCCSYPLTGTALHTRNHILSPVWPTNLVCPCRTPLLLVLCLLPPPLLVLLLLAEVAASGLVSLSGTRKLLTSESPSGLCHKSSQSGQTVCHHQTVEEHNQGCLKHTPAPCALPHTLRTTYYQAADSCCQPPLPSPPPPAAEVYCSHHRTATCTCTGTTM